MVLFSHKEFLFKQYNKYLFCFFIYYWKIFIFSIPGKKKKKYFPVIENFKKIIKSMIFNINRQDMINVQHQKKNDTKMEIENFLFSIFSMENFWINSNIELIIQNFILFLSKVK